MMVEQSPPPLSQAGQSPCTPPVGSGATAIPPLLGQLTDEALLDPWDVAEAIANTVNHVSDGRPDSRQIAEGITAPHTTDGRTGKILLQRAWLDSLSLPQLAEFRRACATLDRQTLTGLFEDVLALFGGQGGTG